MGTIEEVLQQNKFQSLQQKGFLNILFTANWLRENTAYLFKEHGILQQHYNVLRIVKGKKGEPTSPGQIIDVMLDKGRDLTRLVDKLVKSGYLERKTSKTNRRKVEIFLTEEGEKIISEIDIKIVKFYKKMNINDEEANTLSLLLDKIRG